MYKIIITPSLVIDAMTVRFFSGNYSENYLHNPVFIRYINNKKQFIAC